MNGQSSGRSRLEEAQKKQQETIDQGKALKVDFFGYFATKSSIFFQR